MADEAGSGTIWPSSSSLLSLTWAQERVAPPYTVRDKLLSDLEGLLISPSTFYSSKAIFHSSFLCTHLHVQDNRWNLLPGHTYMTSFILVVLLTEPGFLLGAKDRQIQKQSMKNTFQNSPYSNTYFMSKCLINLFLSYVQKPGLPHDTFSFSRISVSRFSR
jgi:hypothetical protein